MTSKTVKTEKPKERLKVDSLRHNEYYGTQQREDELYQRSKDGDIFTNLIEEIFSDNNILLAYRNIRTNDGSKTPGTDGLTIKDIGNLETEEFIAKVRKIALGKGYQPRPVRRKEIPKPNGKPRPLGIPCIYDRIIQQCIKQVIEPICEAKFSKNSFGFRPQVGAEQAILGYMRNANMSKLHYVVEFDIKGFFDEVSHSILIKKIWGMGIHDKHLIYLIKQILKAPIELEDKTIIYPTKGTPQGGIISPILANIYLDELDKWVESNFENHPIANKYAYDRTEEGKGIDKGYGYEVIRNKTALKEMKIVRYADDIRILCKTKEEAEKIKIAVERKMKIRFRLECSAEKTRVVNLRKQWGEFLGFKLKLVKKKGKYVVNSHIGDKAKDKVIKDLIEQIKNIKNPRKGKNETQEIGIYNRKVEGIQNYYQIATHISIDLREVNRRVMIVLTNRMKTQKGSNLIKEGRDLTPHEKKRYGKSKMIRYIAGRKEPIYPIGYCQHKNPKGKKTEICLYTPEGRSYIHDNLSFENVGLLQKLRINRSGRTDFDDNIISLFSAQNGKCSITGKLFLGTEDVHGHHIIPREKGGTDKYENLVLVHKIAHKLIHAKKEKTISSIIEILNLSKDQLEKVNKYRKMCDLIAIKV